MRMALYALIGFGAGALFGSLLAVHALSRASRSLNIETVADRAIADMAQTYEANRRSAGKRLEVKFNECVRDNSLARKRIWDLENSPRGGRNSPYFGSPTSN